MASLLSGWDIGPITSVEPIESFTGKASLVRANGHDYILKEKPDRGSAEREASLLARLTESGAPVAAPLRSRTGDYCLQEGGIVFLLSTRLPGSPFGEHYRDRAVLRAERYGQAIARLHASLLQCGEVEGFSSLDVIEHIRTWALPIVRQHPAEVDVTRLEAAWTAMEAEMGPIYDRLPVQLIHRDAHPGNLLFEGSRLSGIIDFDMVTRGPSIFDLAYCGTSLLMAAYPDDARMNMWLKLRDGLVRGYETTRRLTPEEKVALPGTMIAIELIYVALGLEIKAEKVSKSNEQVIYWLLDKQNHFS